MDVLEKEETTMQNYSYKGNTIFLTCYLSVIVSHHLSIPVKFTAFFLL